MKRLQWCVLHSSKTLAIFEALLNSMHCYPNCEVKNIFVDSSYLHEQIYFQDLCGSEPELKLPSSGDSPIIDPHLSPDGNLMAFVRDDELHVFDFCDGGTRQLTYGAKGNGKVSLPLNSHGLLPFLFL